MKNQVRNSQQITDFVKAHLNVQRLKSSKYNKENENFSPKHVKNVNKELIPFSRFFFFAYWLLIYKYITARISQKYSWLAMFYLLNSIKIRQSPLWCARCNITLRQRIKLCGKSIS